MGEYSEVNFYVFHALWDTINKTHATMMLFQSRAASTAREKGIRLIGLSSDARLISAIVFETSPELADALRQRGLAMHTADV